MAIQKYLITLSLIKISLFIVVSAEYIPPGPKYKCPERPQIIYPCKCLNETDAGLYIRCENSNLANLAVGIHNLAQLNVPIEQLTLYKCHITNLYGKLFYKIKARLLFIYDTPLKELNENLFHGINRTLQELHIINSNFTEFPKMALKILGEMTILNIDQQQITKIDKDAFADSLAAGRLEKLRLTNGHLIELPVESFQVLRKLKILDLHGNNLTTLKRNQFKNLRDVELLDISHNQLKKLESPNIADLTKLTWCNVSHNELTELARGTFARNSVLKVLRMDNNQIKRLDSNSFRGMRFLRHIYFNDNKITDIGRGTFSSLARIGVINLARNLITKIDYQMFSQLNFAELIDVSENNITEIQKQSFKDLYLTVINASHNSISKIESFSFENCANITLLDLSHNQISTIPSNAFDTTTYAYELQFSYNFLTDLSQIPLHNMTGLKVLNVSHNELTTIPKNTFPKLYELQTIDVSYNNISIIANAVFQTLFSLRTIDLSYNSLEQIKSSAFGTLPTLLEMNLNNNQLSDISRGAFIKLISLRFLHLNNNKIDKLFEIPISLNELSMKNNLISSIDEQTWPSMNALLLLDLEGNRLGNNLQGDSFHGLLTLQRLILDRNNISRVPYESLGPLATLRYLHLANNNLTELTKAAFGKLPVVFELNLYGNNIESISKNSFEGLLQLITLNLSSNAIKSIPNEAFASLVSLQQLDLSHNFIEKIDNKTNSLLDDCYSLESINLSHNRFSFLTRKTFPSNPYIPYKLSSIDLSYNLMPVITYDLTIGTKKVKYLNLSHNSINNIRKGVIGNLSSLHTFDLSNNCLEDLTHDAHIFDLPENLTNLYLSNNQLRQIPTKSIKNAKQLKFLDVHENDIETIDWEIVEKIKQGTDINLQNNPLHCDCKLRPLNHYITQFIAIPNVYKELQCNKPDLLANQQLYKIADDYLNCVDNEISGQLKELPIAFDFDILPDIRFRQIFYLKNILHADWYVTTGNRDIADFYVIIRDAKNVAHLEYYLPYDIRSIDIDGNMIPNEYAEQLQICVLAKTSGGNLRSLFDKQCVKLPKEFYDIKRRYTNDYNYAYTIYTNNMKKVSKRTFSKSSSLAGCKRINLLSIFVIILLNAVFYV